MDGASEDVLAAAVPERHDATRRTPGRRLVGLNTHVQALLLEVHVEHMPAFAAEQLLGPGRTTARRDRTVIHVGGFSSGSLGAPDREAPTAFRLHATPTGDLLINAKSEEPGERSTHHPHLRVNSVKMNLTRIRLRQGSETDDSKAIVFG
jgi:hypothetical protein